MDPERLSPVHLVALANYREALPTLDRICDRASDEIVRQWGDCGETDWTPKDGLRHERWWTYPTHSREQPPPKLPNNGTFFEWCLMDEARYFSADGRSAPSLLAGLAADADQLIAGLPGETRARLEDHGFELLEPGTTNFPTKEFILRRAYLEEVVVGPDLDAQASALAKWVLIGFTALAGTFTEPA